MGIHAFEGERSRLRIFVLRRESGTSRDGSAGWCTLPDKKANSKEPRHLNKKSAPRGLRVTLHMDFAWQSLKCGTIAPQERRGQAYEEMLIMRATTVRRIHPAPFGNDPMHHR